MNQYEVMYVIDTALEEGARSELINRFSNIVTTSVDTGAAAIIGQSLGAGKPAGPLGGASRWPYRSRSRNPRDHRIRDRRLRTRVA